MDDFKPIPIYGDPARYSRLMYEIGNLQTPWSFWADLTSRLPVLFALLTLLVMTNVISVLMFNIFCLFGIALFGGCVVRFRWLSQKLLGLHMQAVLCMPYSSDDSPPDT